MPTPAQTPLQLAALHTGISTIFLPNGLQLVTRVIPHAPVCNVWLWYRVGSHYDPVGKSGLSHWVEHLLLMPPIAGEAKSLRRAAARYGGTCNALTSLDYTVVWATVPAEHNALAIHIVTAGMNGISADPLTLERERSVLLAEQARASNDAATLLHYAVRAAAFQAHPYRRRVIGTPHDLRSITHADVRSHFQTYYTPARAVLVAVGDFDLDHLLSLVAQLNSAHSHNQVVAPPALLEPDQSVERQVTIVRRGVAPHVELVYHTPPYRHPDFAPLLMLDTILSGAKAPSFGPGVTLQQRSRLGQALVSAGHASRAKSRLTLTQDPYLFEIHALAQTDVAATTLKQLIDDQIAGIQHDGVSSEELAIALKQLRAQRAYASERTASQAWLLGKWSVLDTVERAHVLMEACAAVQPADVQRVAQTYLLPQRRTVGYLLPEE